MRPVLLALPLTLACAPPNLDDDSGETVVVENGEPSLRIIQPLDQAILQLDDSCTLSFNLAIDVDNFLVGQEATDDGHWHYAVTPADDPYGVAIYSQFAPVSHANFPAGTFPIDVRLVDAGHNDIAGGSVSDRIEIQVQDPSGTCP